MKEFKLSPHRKVDITITSGIYDSGTDLTRFDIPLLPTHTQELTKRVYYYDFKTEESSTDRDLLDQGTIFLIRTVRRDSDIAPANTTNVLSLNPNDYPAGIWFRVEDDGSGSNNIVIGKTDAEVKSALAIYYASVYLEDQESPYVTEFINNIGVTPTTLKFGTGYYKLTFPNVSLDDLQLTNAEKQLMGLQFYSAIDANANIYLYKINIAQSLNDVIITINTYDMNGNVIDFAEGEIAIKI